EKDMQKYVISVDKPNRMVPAYRKELPEGFAHRVAHLDSDVLPTTNFHSETMWLWPPEKSGLKDEPVTFVEPHTHSFPQVIGFFGTDFDDIHKLHGNVELWVQGKKYEVDKSFVAIIPEGVEHGPITIRGVKKPIFHYIVGHAPQYA
ncbi:MAG: hypothetical protein ACPLRM_05035, partial [Anaerolineae bacterium]